MRIEHLALLFVLAAPVVPVAAQQAPAPSTPQSSRPQEKPPAAPYKPDFVIPKPEGSGNQEPQAPATGPAGPGYVIGVGDNLSITVVDEPDFTNKFRVDTDGTITYPYLGRVPVAGAKIGEFQDTLTGLLKKDFIRNPQVRVEIDQYKSRSVYVIGEVRSPGRIVMSGTQMTLLEALALAGSPTAQASQQIIVVHPSKPAPGADPTTAVEGPRVTINRRDLELGKPGLDIALQDGDIVNIGVAQRFYITGQIRNPGFFVLDPGMTIDQAIALAGGLAERGSDRRITVKRLVNGKTVEVPVKLDDKVQPGDTIQIPARFF